MHEFGTKFGTFRVTLKSETFMPSYTCRQPHYTVPGEDTRPRVRTARPTAPARERVVGIVAGSAEWHQQLGMFVHSYGCNKNKQVLRGSPGSGLGPENRQASRYQSRSEQTPAADQAKRA